MKMQKHEMRYGLLKLLQDASVVVPIGKSRGSVKVGDMTRHPAANFVCRCITCKQDFADEKELRAAHPSQKEMVEQEMIHVWAFYSDDPAEEPELVPDGVHKDERKAIEARNAAIPKIGLVSDEPWL